MSLDQLPSFFPTSGTPKVGRSADNLSIPRVTQRDVARAAAVHNSTVSLALSNSPSIPELTRKRIQAVATALGYVPDPALQALVAYRSRRVAGIPRGVVAYITDGATRWGWREIPKHEGIFLGARERAATHGYGLEHFWLREAGLNPRRLSGMLFHRNITGVLITSQRPGANASPDLNWENLSAVRIGCSSAGPALHSVASDCCGNIRKAFRQALAAGYLRIGLILPQSWNDLVDQAWSMGYVAEQSRLPESQHVPILFDQRPSGVSGDIDRPMETQLDSARLERWIHDYCPDVILSWSAHAFMPLLALGLQIPRDLAFVDLTKETAGNALSGIVENHDTIGQVSVETLVRQMQQNIRGIPSVPTATLVEGAWSDGMSMPKRNVIHAPSILSSRQIHRSSNVSACSL